jgi:hypothetical protein
VFADLTLPQLSFLTILAVAVVLPLTEWLLNDLVALPIILALAISHVLPPEGRWRDSRASRRWCCCRLYSLLDDDGHHIRPTLARFLEPALWTPTLKAWVITRS